MNVIRNDNAAPVRGKVRGRGRGKAGEMIINVLPKYLHPHLHFFQVQLVEEVSNTTRTPGSYTSTESCIILAVTSGRGEARGEVGIAAIDVHHSHLILCQMSDYQTYINTLTKIYIFNPIEILMPDTMCNETKNRNKLYLSIREKFPNLCITAVSRIHFNESVGLDRVKTHCAKEYSTVELFLKQKYYALAAASALLKYIEFIQHIVYAPKSIRIEFQGSPNTTVIDIESAQSLELVVSQCGQQNASLLSSMDHCVTPMGRRLLRASILQPLCNEEIIIERQNSITELVSNRLLCNIVQPFVRRLYGADRLLSLSMMTLQNNTAQNAERNLNYVLLLKNSLEIIPELREALESGRASFFVKIRKNLENSQFEIMKNKILQIIHPDARSLIGYTSSNMQRCFAIKPGINDLLDIARQTYCELISDMKNLVENLAIQYKLNLSLECNSSLGFYILAEISPQTNFKQSDLPSEFVQVQKNKNTYSMTTNKLLVLSHQCKIACEDLHIMSNAILNDLLVNIREHIGCLYQLSADVAELDLVISLAHISSSPEYVKPIFGPRLELIDSLHPIMAVFGIERPVPNDVHASIPYNYHTIIGPNMSGKSIYLKQIVLLHIMAQIGCYVPARKAEFRITDRIFCRICFRDDIECNASTFVVEMKEAQYILQSITSKSLVILDELCRGTTVEEGSSITWAICERLLITTAFTFSATHFRYLTKLAEIYYNVTNHCFKTETKFTEGLNEARLVYTHKLMVGVTPIDNYGIALAEVSGLPVSITSKAREYAQKEVTKMKRDDYFTEPNSWEKTCYDRVAAMYKLIENNEFNRRNIVGLIHELEYTAEFKKMQQEEKALCEALESFESTQLAQPAQPTQPAHLNWHDIEMSSKNQLNDTTATYFDMNTTVRMETNETEEVNSRRNLNKQFRDLVDENQQNSFGAQSWFIKDTDLKTLNQNPSFVTQSPHSSPFKINETSNQITTMMNTTSKLFFTSDELLKKQTDLNTSIKSVPTLFKFDPPNIVDKKDSASMETMSVMSPIVSFRCSQISQFQKYSLMESDADISLTNATTLTDFTGINTRDRQINIFTKPDNNSFEKLEFS
ncbi:mutS protein homolog 4-like [Polistes fuscatus]|uniref:mutS protein homolog 4-like n=1 Tax=Polistes fuscatus TaxID=30207 RepID=UPI001CA7E6AA|nr:mutS protein homolog 4-like [Polistes fuscatus]